MRWNGLIARGFLFALPLSAAVFAQAGDWPQWRGAAHIGLSDEKGLPAEFGPEQNVAWRIDLPGPAGATPVVADGRIFLTTVDQDGGLLLMCFGTDGKQQWSRKLAQGNRDVRGDEGNSASPSPVADGKHVWAMMTTGDLACFTADGEEVWKANLQDRYGRFDIQFGMTSSPILHEGNLYLQLIHGEGNPKTREALVVALDAATGDEVWKQDRPSNAIAECEHSYASPTLYQGAEQTYLLTHGADFIVAHDLKDGHELWRCGGLNSSGPGSGGYDPTLRFVASPVAAEGLIVVPTAKGAPVLALEPDGEGDITGSESVRWTYPRTTDVPSPLIHEGLVYILDDRGVLTCLDAETGEEHYRESLHSQRYRSSPVLADGKLYLCARDGVVSVVAIGSEFKRLAENHLGEDLAASPAIADGRIYLRTFKSLFALEQRE